MARDAGHDRARAGPRRIPSGTAVCRCSSRRRSRSTSTWCRSSACLAPGSLLGERITIFLLVGGLTILSGVMLTNRGRRGTIDGDERDTRDPEQSAPGGDRPSSNQTLRTSRQVEERVDERADSFRRPRQRPHGRRRRQGRDPPRGHRTGRDPDAARDAEAHRRGTRQERATSSASPASRRSWPPRRRTRSSHCAIP